ncbi:hypothetical protein B0A49_07951 [Cryomyces minteri]|uniref:ENTH domain-containing protein n=1 Tax=Cryomyces minteri TaxID=331657 RepID=A0A4U0XEA9_9PEZI|nr:hypothetical protein B0A49_07951 [Cryomyces minteri]
MNMDFASLKEAASNLTLYDLKAGVRKVQNAVMNYTEMEAKVREATNNEPWGASTTVMQEIANGTYNYQLLNEIMPMIYKRFTEKAAEEWRQIYKALQLLEYLIKNGSERVIDDARSHLSLLKMLRQFHFIDQNGKDQGLNVRNRSKELAELLSDVDRIRAERKKARATRNKYGGVEGGAGTGGSMSNTSRYGGFGSEDQGGYGGYSGGVFGDGGGFGGQSSDFQDTRSTSRGRDRFEEYDEYDEGATAPSGRRKPDAPRASSGTRRSTRKAASPKPKPKPKEPEVDLFSFGDDDPPAVQSMLNGKQAETSSAGDFGALQPGSADDDEFDDFQSATPATTQAPAKPAVFGLSPPLSQSTTIPSTHFAAPQPRSGAQGANISDLFASISPAPSASATPSNTSTFSPPPLQQPPKPTGYQAAQPNYFTSVPMAPSPAQSASSTPGITSPVGGPKPAAAAGKSSGDAFASLLGGAGAKKAGTPTSRVTMADMAKQKASAGIWGTATAAGPPSQSGAAGQKNGGAFGDLLG